MFKKLSKDVFFSEQLNTCLAKIEKLEIKNMESEKTFEELKSEIEKTIQDFKAEIKELIAEFNKPIKDKDNGLID